MHYLLGITVYAIGLIWSLQCMNCNENKVNIKKKKNNVNICTPIRMHLKSYFLVLWFKSKMYYWCKIRKMCLNQCLLFASGLYLTFAFGMLNFCYNACGFSIVSMHFVIEFFFQHSDKSQTKLQHICFDNETEQISLFRYKMHCLFYHNWLF